MCSALASNATEFFPPGQSGDTSVTRADRLAWLLQGLLEAQSLITDEASDLAAFMQRVVDLAQSLTSAAGAVVELVEGDEMVYRCASGSIQEQVGVRLKRGGSLSGLCVAEARVLRCDDAEQDARRQGSLPPSQCALHDLCAVAEVRRGRGRFEGDG